MPDMPKDAKDIAISQGDKDMDINVELIYGSEMLERELKRMK